jgi:flagellar motor switch/type III secretory pathway protein FliN
LFSGAAPQLISSNLAALTLDILLHEIPHMASAQSLPQMPLGARQAGPGQSGPAPGVAHRGSAAPGGSQPAAHAPGQAGTQALVPAKQVPEDGQGKDDQGSAFSPQVLELPVEVDIAVPVRGFQVRHLLALEPGQVVESQWNSGNDLPLAAKTVQLAWTEFEVVETTLAVRVTRVA